MGLLCKILILATFLRMKLFLKKINFLKRTGDSGAVQPSVCSGGFGTHTSAVLKRSARWLRRAHKDRKPQHSAQSSSIRFRHRRLCAQGTSGLSASSSGGYGRDFGDVKQVEVGFVWPTWTDVPSRSSQAKKKGISRTKPGITHNLSWQELEGLTGPRATIPQLSGFTANTVKLGPAFRAQGSKMPFHQAHREE